MDNSKYTTYGDIFDRLTKLFPSKIIQESDIIAWCAECETEWCGDIESMTTYLKVPLTVTNLQTPVPCNLYRILDVYTSETDPTSRISYYNNGAYLNFNSDMTETTVYINYFGITIDEETGYPLIKQGHEQACEAFCIWKLNYEGWLKGEIDNTKWGYIDQQKSLQIDACKNGFRNIDRKRLLNIKTIINNIQPSLLGGNLYHQGLGE
jgi:hypothetical protein